MLWNLHGKPKLSQHHQKSLLMLSTIFFFFFFLRIVLFWSKSVDLFPQRKNLNYLHLKDFCNHECESYMRLSLLHLHWREVPSLFHNVVLGSLKSVFQLDHQIDISICLTEATAYCYSRNFAFFTPSCYSKYHIYSHMIFYVFVVSFYKVT